MCIEDEETAVQSIPVIIHRLSLDIPDNEKELIIETVGECAKSHGDVFNDSCRDIQTVIKSLPPETQHRLQAEMPKTIYIDPLKDM